MCCALCSLQPTATTPLYVCMYVELGIFGVILIFCLHNIHNGGKFLAMCLPHLAVTCHSSPQSNRCRFHKKIIAVYAVICLLCILTFMLLFVFFLRIDVIFLRYYIVQGSSSYISVVKTGNLPGPTILYLDFVSMCVCPLTIS